MIRPPDNPAIDRDDRGPVLLFDGDCGLCNGAVQLVLRLERERRIRFVPLASPEGLGLLERHDATRHTLTHVRTGGIPDTVVFIDAGRVFTRSDAALRITRYLNTPARWAGVLRIIPRVLRDAAYRVIARSRYRVFGRADACRLPAPPPPGPPAQPAEARSSRS